MHKIALFRNLLFVVALVGAPLFSGAAQASLIFEFSFSDDPLVDNLGNTKVAGTVTGRILGLVDNAAGQTATSVFIDSHPLLNVGFGPLDAGGLDLAPGALANVFDVFGGVITDAYFIRNFTSLNGGTAQLRLNSQDTQEPGANVLRHQNVTGPDQLAVGNRGGMQGISFSVEGGGGDLPVPVPTPLALIGLGLAVAGVRRRKAN